MKLLKVLNPENASDDEVEKFNVRKAVRAVVYDKDGNVAMLNVSKQNYHKLLGGGVEAGEDLLMALKRECQEEIGCDIEVFGEIGEIVEYRKIFQLKQISRCYLAKVVGQKSKPAFTQEEADNGFQIHWLPINEAVFVLNSDQALNDEGRLYIVPRDKTFLEIVKNQH